MARLFALLGSASILGSLTWAAPSADTLLACKEISNALPDRVEEPPSLSYAAAVNEYWSSLLRDLKPACVVRPQDANEVSVVVKTLLKYPDVNFGTKSGGHDPNAGHATAEDGVLINLSKNIGATYDADSGLAYVKPGGEWNDVVSALDKQGVTILGGRLGIVGVGGLLLQGGMSFLSAQHGLAANNIVEWEIVAANGTILHVNEKDHPDLAVALRGSGNQFGIVTQYTARAYPIGKVWGGMRFYEPSKRDDLFKALHEYIPNGATEDPKSAIIFTNLFTKFPGVGFLVFYFYQGEEPPTTGSFADLLAVPSSSSTTKTQSYSDLIKHNGELESILHTRMSFRSFTVPYFKNRPSVYSEISYMMGNLSEPFVREAINLNLLDQCSMDFQPFPTAIAQRSAEKGGNAMGLSAKDPDRFILEIQCGWTPKDQDEQFESITRGLVEWLERKVPEWLAEEGLPANTYIPLFMNDAHNEQNVTGSYRDYAKFKALQKQYDPNGVFSKRNGGWKY